MKQKIIDHLFFCRTHDYLHIYIPQQQNGTANTLATYKAGLRSFRTYVNDIAKILPINLDFRTVPMTFCWTTEISCMIVVILQSGLPITGLLLSKAICYTEMVFR